MKRQYKILMLVILGIPNYYAQSSYSLEVNNIKARVNSSINLFNKIDTQQGGFESVLNNYTSTMFSSNLWLAAELPGGQLATAAENTFSTSEKDFFFGPISDNNVGSNTQNYNRVFVVTKSELDIHIAWFNCQQDPNCDLAVSYSNYSVPQSILDWPAHGDVTMSEAFYLAPFEDTNLDGVYNPYDGDYPLIKGDEAVFYILNDMNQIHTSSGGRPLGIEVHVLVYAYNTNLESVNNTVFVNYKIFNRSKVASFANLKIGVNTDFDIVCAGNDLVGCDTNRNMYYGYNSIADDSLATNVGQIPCSPNTFGAPAQGVKFLNKSMERFSYFGGALNSSMSDPTIGTPIHFYNYLSSKWNDGSPLLYGGNGYPGNTGVSNVATNYAFSSNPSATGGWSQTEETDVRGLGVFEEQNFNMGDFICFDLAYIFNLDKNEDNLENVNQLLVASDEVQDFYDDNQLGCDYLFTSIEEVKEASIHTLVYPNPFSESATLSFSEMIKEGKLELFNSLGQMVKSYTFKNQKEIVVFKDELTEGIYFYQLTDNVNAKANGKLIIK